MRSSLPFERWPASRRRASSSARFATLLGLLLCQPHLASAAVGAPSTGSLSLFPGARSLTYCWVPDTSQGVPTGYLYSLRRCTAVDGIASEVCNEGYELIARDDTLPRSSSSTYLAHSSVCTNDVGSSSCRDAVSGQPVIPCCCHSYGSERGWFTRFSVWAATATEISATPASTTDLLARTAPDIIPLSAASSVFTFPSGSSSVVDGDGRHRSFTWQVPRDNGYAIERYVLRRESTSGGASYDYTFECAATASTYRTSTTASSALTAPLSCDWGCSAEAGCNQSPPSKLWCARAPRACRPRPPSPPPCPAAECLRGPSHPGRFTPATPAQEPPVRSTVSLRSAQLPLRILVLGRLRAGQRRGPVRRGRLSTSQWRCQHLPRLQRRPRHGDRGLGCGRPGRRGRVHRADGNVPLAPPRHQRGESQLHHRIRVPAAALVTPRAHWGWGGVGWVGV